MAKNQLRTTGHSNLKHRDIWFEIANRPRLGYFGLMSAISAQEFELLAFFGRDPEVLDPQVPWIYNTLTYRQAAGNVGVQFKIAPSYKRVNLQITNTSQVIYRFDGDVQDVQYVETVNNEQLLNISLARGTTLTLRIKPEILLTEATSEK